MIYIKNREEIECMRASANILRDVFNLIQDEIKVGMTTKEIDKIAYNYIKKQNAVPNFLNYNGFPATLCISIDDQIIHGIPSNDVVIEEGQLVSIDGGCIFKGFHSDAARTFEIGKVSEEKHKLVEVTKQSFFEGVKFFKEGNRLYDISSAIQQYVESNGFSVVKDFVGHGIGRNLHEDPSVPNYGRAHRGVTLDKGMALAIEPMVNAGTDKIRILDDEWTVITQDGKPSAHYENTVVLTDNGAEILTL